MYEYELSGYCHVRSPFGAIQPITCMSVVHLGLSNSLFKRVVFDENISHGFDISLDFQTNFNHRKTTERFSDRGTAGDF